MVGEEGTTGTKEDGEQPGGAARRSSEGEEDLFGFHQAMAMPTTPEL